MKLTVLAFLSLFLSASAVAREKKDTIIKVEADPQSGFYYPYFVYIPDSLSSNLYLLVEPNNTGTVNDTLEVHIQSAFKQIGPRSFSGPIAKRLGTPLLIPAFPRPYSNWKVYTHALDGEAMHIKNVDYKRLDLQLIAMIKDVKKRLQESKISVNEKVLLNGFSASGSFVNRFTILHPDMVKAVACGGINGIAILPTGKSNGEVLEYPIGINNYKELVGQAFNLALYQKVPQFLYMGANDNNDATLYQDAYSTKEAQLVYKVLGKEMLPVRFKKVEEFYKKADCNAMFKIYDDIGHGTNRTINQDIINFFRANMN